MANEWFLEKVKLGLVTVPTYKPEYCDDNCAECAYTKDCEYYLQTEYDNDFGMIDEDEWV